MVAKKVNNKDIIELNSVGIGLNSMATRLDCHHTTITARLKQLNIAPADTRRSFMEDIYDSLSNQQREFLVGQLGPAISIKDYIRSLIINDFVKENP